MRWLSAITLGLLTACRSPAPPPPALMFAGLPVSGDRGFAERLGFSPCFTTSNALRCRRDGVRLFDTGPYRAAVDLPGSGASGFGQLTLWHDDNQNAVFAISDALHARGWQRCNTGSESRGDQEVWTRRGARVRFSMDLSYWGKRRLRIMPEHGQPTGKCW